MKRFTHLFLLIIPFLLLIFAHTGLVQSQDMKENKELDARVQKFLESHRNQWHDMNIPESDGKLLYDIIVKNGYKNAVEIGTSTGRSGIWMAWALSKNGGKLTTIEIDESRHNEAVKNFEKAGLSDYIDARLADAHELVPQLDGPIDFVFHDADKNWSTNYFKALDPKLVAGGCFTVHNVHKNFGYGGTQRFLKYIQELPNYITTVDDSGGGLSISYKKSE